ncbi:response regulator transcription factor [Streptacidiphilus sp. P02-A3a]|uniref:response regulator transcription factor n=1 Tax=Streptacidiphilus sp. P02-A3a TaxID=2704468 RepID=UPI0015F78E93|nr:response regulator transcription factor [Streptacidiphilus sp. P02-A3a]QMU71788.1 response regulator transcription factor [Streptacidiphilus sp. P02-A3a]
MVAPDTAPAPGALRAAGPQVRVRSSDATARAAVEAKLLDAGLRLALTPNPSSRDVLVAVGDTVEGAIEACGPAFPGADERRLVVVADVLSRHGARQALRAGARAMVLSAEATPERLAAAVHSAHRDEGRLSHLVLARLLNGASEPTSPGRRPGTPQLTHRQLEVLRLMADGRGNEAIARTLRCSKHTVKNVIYELMGQLQVRNRAHAVAHAVRTGLI